MVVVALTAAGAFTLIVSLAEFGPVTVWLPRVTVNWGLLLERIVTFNKPAVSSESLMVNVCGPVEAPGFSAGAKVGIGFGVINGAVLVALTLNVVVVTRPPPSVTVTVITSFVKFAIAFGMAIVSVRFAPEAVTLIEPPFVRIGPPAASVAVTVSRAAAVSLSPTPKGRISVAPWVDP